MKIRNLVGQRFRERPSDCATDSHALMIRGGYMKSAGSGIFSEYPALRRVTAKIEKIIREEMDAIDGQEVLFPVVMPAELWEESGRYRSVGEELVRFRDRNNSAMVLGMTHEEAAVHLVREYGVSYRQYPFMIYQIQRKFRDEARPRAGMIRVREFTMKDAYSFHTSREDMEKYYQQCFDAYHRIFRRTGIPQVVSVASDSGMMGGSVSHEYMLLNQIGEDSVVICTRCDYKANMEAAVNIPEYNSLDSISGMQPVETPDCKTIEEVCAFLNTEIKNSCKAVIYQKDSDGSYIAAFIRGDYEINETKLRNLTRCDIHPAVIEAGGPLVAGYTGPYGLDSSVECYFDRTIEHCLNLVTGANKEGFHITGFCPQRDIPDAVYYDIAKVKDGSICPVCGKHSIQIRKGIEVGNIFQLGTKYTESMNMWYTDKDGSKHHPLMGCYGIGVGRLAASICEEYHDDYGPVWPVSIAPWEVHICCLRADDEELKQLADSIYEQLKEKNVEVIYDDRTAVRAGEMFADADLLGVPVRVIVSPKNFKEGKVEICTRDKKIKQTVDIPFATEYIINLKNSLYAEL